ncbi:MAG: hypothetical protein IPJ19_01480 [Planctomycetes bacterium]|nr:hypothetical protein [Planctomycetota bacterium]
MVAQRRVGPLLAVLGLGLLVLLGRAFQVQVLEHPVWAAEAAGMLQSSELVPYHRGSILDRNGSVLARDEDRFELRLCYRDFRRGSPVAQIAHARSTLELRAVGLAEAEAHLEDWARQLVELTPQQLYAFAKGASLDPRSSAELTPEDARLELRDRRAGDLRFYAAELLELPARQRKCLTPKPESPEVGWTLLALAAHSRGLPASDLEKDLLERLRVARERLAHLAELVEHDGGRTGDGATPLARLLELLEGERRAIEDDAANALFREAAGFDPGRLRTQLLEEFFDTAWIGRALRWDAARLSEWSSTRRERWERIATSVLLPRVLTRTQSEPIVTRRADRMLSELALLWASGDQDLRGTDDRPRSWREFDEPCVEFELDSIFEDVPGAGDSSSRRAALPFQSQGLEDLAHEEDDRWRLVGALTDLAHGTELTPEMTAVAPDWKPPVGSLESAQRWRRFASRGSRLDGDEARIELTGLFFALESHFQDELARDLERMREQSGVRGPFAFAEERLSRATDAERFLLLDRSTRPAVVCKQPSWDLVELVTRGAADYDGFRAMPVTVRVHPEQDAAGVGVATGLVGNVRRPRLSDLLAERRERGRLAELRAKLVRSSEEQAEMRELATELLRQDDWTGGTGVEAWLDKQLRGRDGYEQSFSLADEAQAAEADLVRPPVDGAEVKLTLDSALQRAAQAVLEHPVMPNGDESDQLWCKFPVGAIVLLTPEGDLLAAASVPSRGGLPRTPGRDAEHSFLRERTLQMPTSNPPGSCFKPFVAAYALDRLGLTEGTQFGCLPLEKGWGYRTIHCHHHGVLALEDALVHSCNAYFGQVGEKFYTPEQFLAMAHLFGFDEPTGIGDLAGDGGHGIHEDFHIPKPEALPGELADLSTAMRFSCGLMPMEATPMQVARATASLVTGELPDVRLVASIGGHEVPHRARPLGIAPDVLAFVRRAMVGVVERGTASADPLHDLGFSFACKTGSADLGAFKDSKELTDADRADMLADKSRKHAWISGWFPAENPRAIVVVYLHEVSETASKSAVWVTAQLLHEEAVKRYALGEDVQR